MLAVPQMCRLVPLTPTIVFPLQGLSEIPGGLDCFHIVLCSNETAEPVSTRKEIYLLKSLPCMEKHNMAALTFIKVFKSEASLGSPSDAWPLAPRVLSFPVS